MSWALHNKYDNVQNLMAHTMGNCANPLLARPCFANEGCARRYAMHSRGEAVLLVLHDLKSRKLVDAQYDDELPFFEVLLVED